MNWKVLWMRRSLRIICRFLKEELPSNQVKIQDSNLELIINWKVNPFVASVTCSRYQIAFKLSVNFWLQLLSIQWDGKYFNRWNFYWDILQIQHKFKTRRCGSVYLGVVVLRVWYFEHALLQLNNCHHILPEKINPLLHLFAEPHSLYSMSQSTTKIVSFHDNVWKYAHLQCRHAWRQIAT